MHHLIKTCCQGAADDILFLFFFTGAPSMAYWSEGHTCSLLITSLPEICSALHSAAATMDGCTTEVLKTISSPSAALLISSLSQTQWLKGPKKRLVYLYYVTSNSTQKISNRLFAFLDHKHQNPSRPPRRNFALTCRCFSLSFHFLHPHVLYQYLQEPKRAALKMKERNFTLCQKKEWKLQAVSDNWACRKRHVNNRQRCRRLVTPYPGWQTLSAVDELF